jgi:hypothetical protein
MVLEQEEKKLPSPHEGQYPGGFAGDINVRREGRIGVGGFLITDFTDDTDWDQCFYPCDPCDPWLQFQRSGNAGGHCGPERSDRRFLEMMNRLSPNQQMHRTTAPRCSFMSRRLFGHWIRSQSPLPAVVGELGRSLFQRKWLILLRLL